MIKLRKKRASTAIGQKDDLSRRTKIWAICFATLITLGMAELGLRALWHNPYRRESPDHLLKLRMHHPNTDHIFSRVLLDPENPRGRLRTDARSYILPSIQYSDPDATVAFLGGSTTECSAVQEDMRFHALVAKLLAAQDLKVNSLNVARAGNTLHDSLNVLLNHVVDDRPDIAVLMHASNDIGMLFRKGDYRARTGFPVSSQDLSKWFLQIVSSKLYLLALVRHSATSDILRPRDPRLDWRHDLSLIKKIPVDLYRQRLKAFVHICHAFGIQPVLMTQPFSSSTNSLTPDWIDRTAQDRFNTIVRTVGKEDGIPVIDLVHHLLTQVPEWNKPMEIFYDAIHITDKGSQVYAQHIAERLLMLIRQLNRRADWLPTNSHANMDQILLSRSALVGEKKNVVYEYSAAPAFVPVSCYEGLPNAVCASMACCPPRGGAWPLGGN